MFGLIFIVLLIICFKKLHHRRLLVKPDCCVAERILRCLAFLRGSRDPNHDPSVSPFDILRDVPHVMTRGVDVLGKLQTPPITLWDFAGQLEFFPAHRFFLSDAGVVFVLVFDASYDFETALARLTHWLEFVRSVVDPERRGLFGPESHLRSAVNVLLVASHTDSIFHRVIV